MLWCLVMMAMTALVIATAQWSFRYHGQGVAWYEWLAAEAGVLEILQAVCLLASSFLLIRAVVVHRLVFASLGHKMWIGPMVLAVILLVAAGEEINWGQHWLGFGTPAIIIGHHLGAEFNIHDMTIGGVALAWWANVVLQVFNIAYLVLLPIACCTIAGVRRGAERLAWPMPPLAFVPFGVFGALVSWPSFCVVVLRFDSYPPLWPVSEMRETILYLAIMGTVLLYDRRWKAMHQSYIRRGLTGR